MINPQRTTKADALAAVLPVFPKVKDWPLRIGPWPHEDGGEIIRFGEPDKDDSLAFYREGITWYGKASTASGEVETTIVCNSLSDAVEALRQTVFVPTQWIIK